MRRNKLLKGQRLHSIWVWASLWLALGPTVRTLQAEVDPILARGRQAFYASVEQENQINTALETFETLTRERPELRGLATTYIGAIITLKGKHAFLPQRKYGYVLKGLRVMEKGLNEAPDNLEALFIYGMTCYHLPFFFGRRDDAVQALRHTADLLGEGYQQYDSVLVRDVVQFLRTEMILTTRQTAIIDTIEKNMDQ